MSQHIIEVQTPQLGEIEVMIGFDPCLREFFGAAQTTVDDECCYHSAPFEDLASIQTAIKVKLGVTLPAAMVAGTEKDQKDFQQGWKDVGRRIVRYDQTGAVVQREAV